MNAKKKSISNKENPTITQSTLKSANRRLDNPIEDSKGKRSEEELNTSENELRALFAAMTNIVIVYDTDGRYIRIAPTNPTNLYRPQNDMQGKTVHEILPKEQADLIIAKIREAIQTGKVVHSEYVLRIDGKETWFAATASRFSKNTAIWVAHDITERKSTEQSLHESEEKYRSIVETTSEWIWEMDITGKHTFSNKAVTALLGYSPEEILGQPAISLLHAKDRLEVEAKLPLLIAEKSGWRGWVLRWRHKDGSYRFFESNAEPILDSTGFVRGYRGSDRDITERKQAEEALRQSEARWRFISQATDEGIVVHKQGRILDVNETGANFMGYTREELIGQSILILSHPDSHETILNKMRSGSETPCEVTGMRKDGTTFPCELRGRNLIFQGEPVRVVVVRDLTERKQTQTLQEAVYRIAGAAETTSSLDELYPQIHQIISSVMPAENFYITLYDEAQNLLRFPYFRDAKDEPFMHGIQPAKGLSAYVLRTGKSLLCTQAVHDELERKGEVKLLGVASAIWLGVPLIVEGKTIGAMVVQHYSDPKAYGEREQHMLEFVSTQVAIAINRKRAEDEIRHLNAELEKRVEERTRELHEAQEQLVRKEKLATLGQLAGGVGHELRNPLGVINTSIYYLKLVQPEADEKIKEHLEIIEQEVHNSERIINDLLDFGRVVSAEQETVWVPDLVKRTLDRFPLPSTVEVSLKLPANLPPIYTDPRQMEQVLGNLITNSCQAMNLEGKLTISARLKKKMVGIAVKDTGTGISPENMKKLFEPLFTTKVKGIGLGLAVSKKLAEANDGRIEVESVVGKGSTFTLYLPVKP